MAGPNLSIHYPIEQVQEKAGTTPFTSAQPELAGQTFASSTPVQLTAAGFVQAWDGATVTAGILGVAESFGQNLASNGVGAPTPPFGQITGNIAIATYGSVPNQPSAVNIALGTPVADGRTLYLEPRESTIFQAMFDNSNGSVAADYTPTQADIGVKYGMTKDSGGPYWYVDKNKTAGNAVLQIVGIGPDGFVLNGRVKFVFLAAAVQVI